MTQITGFILTLWSIYSTCIAMPDIHRQMSAHQLQSIFHTDSVDSVPNYELVQLNHLGTEHNGDLLRHRRSVNNLPHPDVLGLKETHHVKKDLSKNPYYSELKLHAHQSGGGSENSVSDLSYSEKLKNLDLSAIKEHNVTFSAFGEVLNLTLRPTDGLFKEGPDSLRMWTVRSEPNATHGLALEEVLAEDQQPTEEIGQVFQDEDNMAAILMRRHLQTGDLMMEGSIGHQMVIKPLPIELSPSQDKTHHVIYKREANPLDHLSDFAFMEPDDIETSERQKRSAAFTSHLSKTKRSAAARVAGASRSRREAPFMIYPEILVIVDYDGYRLHGGDNLQVKRYFISFWNGVDLRYRLLKGPRIRISIAGIIISRGRDATPYLERNRVGRDAIDSAAALTDMGKYLFRERRLPVYDIAVAITKYDMCRRRKGGRCTKGTAGFAYVGGACVVNKRLEKVNSVAIIEDTGGFSGIIVAAHEVGHLLGAVHDGSPPPSYLGGPGAERCRWEDGYIMSDLRHTERGFRWSPCTVQSFHHFLNGETASCLHNAPHEDNALGRSLPGTLLSLDAQCRRDRGTYACFKDERVCAQLFCFDAQTGYCVAYRPAAEGSSCGNGVHCLDGRCTPLPTNVIQDYGPQYRVVYNAEQDFDDNSNEDYYENNDNEDEASSLDITDELSSSNTSTTQTSPTTTSTTTATTTTTTTPESILTTTSKSVRPLKLYRKIRLRNLSNNKTRTFLKHIKTTTTTSRVANTTNSNTNTTTNTNSSISIVINSTPQTPSNSNISALRKTYDLYIKNFLHKSKANSNRTRHSTHPPPNYSSTTFAPQTATPVEGAEPPAPTTADTSSSSSSSSDVDSNETLDDTYQKLSSTQRSYVLGGRSTTRSSLFDTYFRKRTNLSGNSSKHIVNQPQPQLQLQLQQQQQQQQMQASPPAYTTNYLGDNTNNSPINIPKDRSYRSSRSGRAITRRATVL